MFKIRYPFRKLLFTIRRLWELYQLSNFWISPRWMDRFGKIFRDFVKLQINLVTALWKSDGPLPLFPLTWMELFTWAHIKRHIIIMKFVTYTINGLSSSPLHVITNKQEWPRKKRRITKVRPIFQRIWIPNFSDRDEKLTILRLLSRFLSVECRFLYFVYFSIYSKVVLSCGRRWPKAAAYIVYVLSKQ